jgi:hypothetical protein
MIGALATNVVLASEPFYVLTLAGQLFGYTLSALGLAAGQHTAPRTLRLATMFPTMNAALLVGFPLWASGGQGGVWQRTVR